MVLILPEGFELAPADHYSEEMKKKLVTFTNHTARKKNILVVGPVPGNNILKW
jgi:hypothetical protein